MFIQSGGEEERYTGPNGVYYGQTALKYIMDHLGYRFVVKNSMISERVKQSEKFAISLDIENTGFGNTVNLKNAKIILEKDNETLEADLNINTRNWLSNSTYTEKIIMTVPSDIEIGEWNIYLKIYDKFNEDYTIRFANDNMWSDTLEANKIGTIEIVEKTNPNTDVEFKQVYY